jgi:serine/threonine-protein kinase RsbW
VTDTQGHDGPSVENSVSLRLANGPLAAPVLCRVVSMVLARADCPMDRLDDAMIVCDTLSAHAPAYSSDGHLTFTVATDRRGVELRVSELAAQGAGKLLADAAVPGVGNVLERLSDELQIEPSGDGTAGEELVLKLRFD